MAWSPTGWPYWPSDQDYTYFDFVRNGTVGSGAVRMGNAHWLLLTKKRAGSAKSVFHFDVQGSVTKSTHADIPWLHFEALAISSDSVSPGPGAQLQRSRGG
ncbi:MAG: hypothetical protein ACT4SY_05685 [Hyphomicrobiales bacterium]